jgi:tRNA (guanosine-2'-O-)-methyltransferase
VTRHARLACIACITCMTVLAGCGPASPASSPGSNLVAKNVVTSDGSVVTSACTPTGPEICFNASDDNCNGVIDEGCGVGTGVLQFVVAWGDSPADIDIVVSDPTGSKVHKSNRSTNGGLQLEKNCPEDGCHGQNLENVFFEGVEPPRGKYVVEVKLVEPHGAELPVRAHLSARVGNRTFAMDLLLAPGGAQEKQGFTFEL